MSVMRDSNLPSPQLTATQEEIPGWTVYSCLDRLQICQWKNVEMMGESLAYSLQIKTEQMTVRKPLFALLNESTKESAG